MLYGDKICKALRSNFDKIQKEYLRGNFEGAYFPLNQYQLACYGLVLGAPFYGYDTETGEMNFYTSSYRALQQMASKGELVAKKGGDVNKDLVRFERNLTGDNIKESLKSGNTLKVVRLDPTNYGDKVVYTGVIPRQDLDLEKVHIVSY